MTSRLQYIILRGGTHFLTGRKREGWGEREREGMMIYSWQKITGMQFLVLVCTSTVSLKLFQSKNLTSTEQRGFQGRGGWPHKGREAAVLLTLHDGSLCTLVKVTPFEKWGQESDTEGWKSEWKVYLSKPKDGGSLKVFKTGEGLPWRSSG